MKILIVEDDHRLRKSLLDYIRDEGFAADDAEDGEIGLYRALNWEYDLIVLDVMLPKLDGWQILEQLRANDKLMPVIMLTARDAVSDRIKGLDRGADDYLVKPFEMDELIARIRAALRRAVGNPTPKLKSGDLELHTSTRSVVFQGEEIILTAREYAMLEIFVSRKNELITRDYFYDHLFDERDQSISNIIDVYIYKLRQKFGKDRFQTRRGMGHTFVG